MTGKLGPYDLNTIVTGDARELAKSIPDESVDLIFTDPVYSNIDDYRWLAETASRVLRPEGHLLAWQNVRYWYDTATQLKEKLFERYTFVLTRSNACVGTNGTYVLQLWTPLLWYSKQDKVKPIVKPRDSIDVPMISGDSALHQWQKPIKAISYWLKCFSHPGATILDPFTGGGTVPAVCKMLSRNYLAFEIDPETAEKARERVLLTQPPLFVPQPEQLSLMDLEDVV
jgi:DNA modification methylase